MKFEDVFLTEKQTILGPDRDVGSVSVTHVSFQLGRTKVVRLL